MDTCSPGTATAFQEWGPCCVQQQVRTPSGQVQLCMPPWCWVVGLCAQGALRQPWLSLCWAESSAAAMVLAAPGSMWGSYAMLGASCTAVHSGVQPWPPLKTVKCGRCGTGLHLSRLRIGSPLWKKSDFNGSVHRWVQPHGQMFDGAWGGSSPPAGRSSLWACYRCSTRSMRYCIHSASL